MTFLFWAMIVIGFAMLLLIVANVFVLIGRVLGWGRIYDEEAGWNELNRQRKHRLAREFEKENSDGN